MTTATARIADAAAPRTIAPPAARLALSMQEAADTLGVSRGYAYILWGRGELQTFTLGRRRMVSVDSLRDLVRRREAE